MSPGGCTKITVNSASVYVRADWSITTDPWWFGTNGAAYKPIVTATYYKEGIYTCNVGDGSFHLYKFLFILDLISLTFILSSRRVHADVHEHLHEALEHDSPVLLEPRLLLCDSSRDALVA